MKFFRLSCRENLALSLNEISNRLRGNEVIISLEHIRLGSIIADNDYAMCKFVKELVPPKPLETGSVLHLLLAQVTVDVEGKSKELLSFKTIFHNEESLALKKALQFQKISSGDIIVLQKPVILPNTEEQISSKTVSGLRVEVGLNHGQEVSVWQHRSNAFLQSYLETFQDGYKHLMIYSFEDLGSIGHATKNLLCLIRGRGYTAPMKRIVGNSECIALAVYKKLVISLRTFLTGSDIQMSFEEMLLAKYSDADPEKGYSPKFNAFFFDETAKEIQKAIGDGHLVPGTLVAFIHPLFDKFSASPVRIRFPRKSKVNLIILKSFLSVNASSATFGKVSGLKSNNPSGNFKNSENYVTLDKGGFTAQHYLDILNKLDFIINSSEQQHIVKVHGLKNAYKSTKESITAAEVVVLLYFLKIVYSERSCAKTHQAILFGREILPDNKPAYFVKVILHKNLANFFWQASLVHSIGPGDVLVFVNPKVGLNPEYTSREVLAEEPYFMEAGFLEKQKMFLCKLRKFGLTNRKKRGTGSEEVLVYDICSSDLEATNTHRELAESLCRAVNDESDLAQSKRMCLRSTIANDLTQNSQKNLSVRAEKFLNSTRMNATCADSHKTETLERVDQSRSRHFASVKTLHENLEPPKRCRGSTLRNVPRRFFEKRLHKKANPAEQSKKKAYSNNPQIGGTRFLNDGFDSSLSESEECSAMLTEVSRKSARLPLVPHRQGGASSNFVVGLLDLKNPFIDNEGLNLISGHCSRSCFKMFLYPLIVWSTRRKPHCPICCMRLELKLCMEFTSVMLKSGDSVVVLLAGDQAEDFLGVSCEEFVSNPEFRVAALKNLRSKYATSGESKNCKLKLSKATEWHFAEAV